MSFNWYGFVTSMSYIKKKYLQVFPGVHSDDVPKDFVTINTEDKDYCQLGIIENFMVIAVDFSLILGSGNS